MTTKEKAGNEKSTEETDGDCENPALRWTKFKVIVTISFVIIGISIIFKNARLVITEGIDIGLKTILLQIFTVLVVLHLGMLFILPGYFQLWSISFGISIVLYGMFSMR